MVGVIIIVVKVLAKYWVTKGNKMFGKYRVTNLDIIIRIDKAYDIALVGFCI